MALSFVPKYHEQTEPGKWGQLQARNAIAPITKYPSWEEIKAASDEAEKIKGEGDEVIIVFFDPKAN